MSDYGQYLIMYISRGAEPRNKLYYCDLTSLEGGKISGMISEGYPPPIGQPMVYSVLAGILPMKKLIDDFEASWDVSGDDPLPVLYDE